MKPEIDPVLVCCYLLTAVITEKAVPLPHSKVVYKGKNIRRQEIWAPE